MTNNRQTFLRTTAFHFPTVLKIKKNRKIKKETEKSGKPEKVIGDSLFTKKARTSSLCKAIWGDKVQTLHS